VSAKKKINLDKLIETILLQAEILELKADADRTAEGVVVEARMDKGRGSVATVLVQKGTLDVGDIFVCGNEWGRVRSLFNDHGQRVQSATPAQPVEVIGLQGTPAAGDDFIEVETEAQAREISAYRQRKDREVLQVKTMSSAEHLLAKIKAGEIKELPVVIKGDVQGSVEALNGILAKIRNDEVKVSIIHSGVGAINESDVSLARASKAIVIGFNVRANPTARELAKRDGVDIRYYSIVYDVADDMKLAVEGLLTPELREKILGYAEVRQVISVSKVGKVAGCMVKEGLVRRGAKVRILRDGVVIYNGALTQLKRFKDDVKEVKESFECGMSFENYDDVKVGDMVECYEMEEIAVKLKLSENI
jgi:translation initiation factor IF-2